ncbi:MAG TPA: hypothetical protein VKP88_01335, partial [Candidatus Paceibacterota bacterium]|nr:hypothetical protein [Candidatus Paceibacterota bacterium]
EPEDEESGSNTDGDDGTPDGDLDSELTFAFWVDDGDNVFETDEEVFLDGSLDSIGQLGSIALADSAGSILEDNGPVPGGETFTIGKIWCFGNLEEAALAPDDGSPINRDSGFTCNGAAATNIAQTDSVEGDLEFYAVQSRNNGEFQCSDWQPEFIGQEVPRPTVGAALASYEAPTCDVTVNNLNDLVAAVDGASVDQTICVGDGDYDLSEPLVLDTEGVTLASLNGPLNTATISGGIFVDANNVTVTGFVFDSFDFMGSSENAAIYVHNEAGQGSGVSLTGLEISYNLFEGPDGAATNPTGNGQLGANAVINEIPNAATPQFSNSVITHNVFDGWRRGVFLNPSTGIEVSFNDFYNNFVGSANDGPGSNSVVNNDFEGNTAESLGVSDADNGTGNDNILLVNTNNIADGAVNNYGSV